MQGVISFDIEEQVTSKQIRAWKDRAARTEKTTIYKIKVTTDNKERAKRKKILGWRVYATNSCKKDFTIEKAVLMYRKEYIIERRFDYLKNKPLNLIPLYLRCDKYILGLINVMLLALRIITLMEFNVARNLEKNKKEIAGLYAGNPKHKTSKPSVSLILRAFLNIYCIAMIDMNNNKIKYEITTLTHIQKKLLRLMDIPIEIYTNLGSTVNYQNNAFLIRE